MQKKTFSTVLAIALSAAVLMLAGCGGSGGSASPTVSGIAATGKAIEGNVRLKDSSTPSRELTVGTGTDGSYVVNVAGLTPPFLVKAEWTTEAGRQGLVSFAANVGTANITPLSNAIVASAAGVTDPVALFDAPTPAVQGKIAAGISAATSELQSKLQPLIARFPGAEIDPIKGAFAANHTGLDAMLDAVTIKLAAGTLTVSNTASGSTIFTAPVTQVPGGTFTPANMPDAPVIQAPAPHTGLDGAALYAAHCASCHNPLASSNKKGASVARTQTAITAGIGGMGYLSTLTSQEIQAIVTALQPTAAPTTPAPTPTPAPSSPTTPAPIPAPPVSADGATLYDTNCGGCHGPLVTSTKKGMTATRLQAAVSGNIGGMGYLSTLTAAENQAIVDAMASSPAPAPSPSPAPAPSPAPTPAPAPAPADAASLYATNCANCHGTLANSTKKGITLARLQSSISGNAGGMGVLSSLSSAEQQAIVNVLAVVTPAPAPAPTPTTPVPVNGTALYGTKCAGCHGALATSNKKGITLARLDASISGNAGGMGTLSTLTAAERQAIVDVLIVTTPTPTPTPVPTPTPTPAPADGATLYGTNCAGCHGPLASSGKAGATATRTQTAINGNVGGMGYLSTLTATQVQAITTALATVTPSPTPAPAPACGSCHALPPSTGKHAFHSNRATCATCHGTGYSTTAVNAATHNNGVKNLTTTIGWNTTSRSCSNSCHGSKRW